MRSAVVQGGEGEVILFLGVGNGSHTSNIKMRGRLDEVYPRKQWVFQFVPPTDTDGALLLPLVLHLP